MSARALPDARSEVAGVAWGLVGVVAFSLTVPATRIAVIELDPVFVALGRALIAACCAAVLLAVTRQPLPTRRQFGQLAAVASCVVVGFPVLMSWAMRRVPATHGAILLGALPALTALAAVVRGGERPSARFWVASLGGCAAVVAFAAANGTGGLEVADATLLVAIAGGAFGYAEGARIAREIGGWQVICWALVVAAPLLIVPFAAVALHSDLHASAHAWSALAYVSLVSQFLGFFAWYHGLALGGTARVGQTQLVQPFLTLAASAWLLGERVTPTMLATAAFVVAAVAVAVRARIATASAPAD
jgi:drug/metabolite transporter (DMT)-like permease